MRLWRDRLPSPLGTLLLVFDDAALVALEFEDHEPRMLELLRRYHGADVVLEPGTVSDAVRDAVAAYFAGHATALDGLAVRTGGSAFQRRVWDALRRIPYGTTTSYGRLAAALGMPKASRAVGLANGANPVSIVVPCHRVIGADGTLTGYGGGLPRKAWLIRHEAGLEELRLAGEAA
ncbi:MAG: methylated-DNA--[protein]-cysteine S-methyltransferase [Acetobacteraceae bacterium]|nr:methylated-DNA--[protein]-cysteine S-methyltransferase [Acetobacteraceae bacterium]